MVDFKYFTPTEVVFGKDSEQYLASLVRKYGGTKVLIHYGGGSVVRSGLLDQIKGQLDEAGIAWVELGGVVPNPRLSLVYQGIELCRREGVDFLLAVGGGSVIDSAKVIGYGLRYDGDVWDLYEGKHIPVDAAPVGVVLTIPASGSEMSDSAVITKDEGLVKRGVNSDLCRPRFAIMNPERTYTLPPYQTAAGVTDIMMHTMERYFSHDDDMLLTDAMAEALMKTVKECGERVLADPQNYQLRAQIMWAGSLAHNNLTGCGTTSDFATHRIEHELSATFGVTHGAGLAAIWPHWAEYVLAENPTRFAQFAVNVAGVPNDFKSPERTARAGIAAMVDFYHRIGMPASLPELIGRPATEEEMAEMAFKATRGRSVTLGKLKVLDYDDVVAIYRKANRG
ncbi:MAG: iron-containing alcohol dehydrogenase [Bacteroidales bacterium]|nr:iron-containing alcohol dehydrogenase [Bacteroidales bacterium]